jgi:crossover junction endodeoxyribonuclease RuvC
MGEENPIVAIGIDPGISGAVAVLYADGFSQLFDTPNLDKDYDLAGMADLLRGLTNAPVIIESVHSMPNQGVSSTFKFGRGLGLWEGICAGLKLQVDKASPQRWKKHFPELKGLEKPAAKSKARELAARLYPNLKASLKLVKNADRAEALLMATYLRDTTNAKRSLLDEGKARES